VARILTSMSQNNTSILYVGLDVAKLSLELHLAGKSLALANTPKGHLQLLKQLRAYPQSQVICEASGGYEQAVVRVLQAAQIPASIVEAGRVRHYARAQGQRAKTDPIDASLSWPPTAGPFNRRRRQPSRPPNNVWRIWPPVGVNW
jgi:hypothetical protein